MQDEVIQKFKVTKNESYANRDLYVAVDGKAGAEGTLEAPLDLKVAIDYITPGYTIYVRGGEYEGITISLENSGNKDALKGLQVYEDEKVMMSAASIKVLVALGLLENAGQFNGKVAVTREEMALVFERLLKCQ